MFEAKVGNLVARIAIQADNAALSEGETTRWIANTNAEVNSLQFEIEHSQNIEIAVRALLVEKMENARDRLRVLELDQI